MPLIIARTLGFTSAFESAVCAYTPGSSSLKISRQVSVRIIRTIFPADQRLPFLKTPEHNSLNPQISAAMLFASLCRPKIATY